MLKDSYVRALMSSVAIASMLACSTPASFAGDASVFSPVPPPIPENVIARAEAYVRSITGDPYFRDHYRLEPLEGRLECSDPCEEPTYYVSFEYDVLAGMGTVERSVKVKVPSDLGAEIEGNIVLRDDSNLIATTTVSLEGAYEIADERMPTPKGWTRRSHLSRVPRANGGEGWCWTITLISPWSKLDNPKASCLPGYRMKVDVVDGGVSEVDRYEPCWNVADLEIP